MKIKNLIFRAFSTLLVFVLLFSMMSVNAQSIKNNYYYGKAVSHFDGTNNQCSLSFQSENDCIEAMTLACENSKYKLYFHKDNMLVALVEKSSGKIYFSNPYDASNNSNYSGDIANRLASQVVLTYLENQTSLVEMFSSKHCADIGQYSFDIYKNSLVVNLSIGEEKDNLAVPNVITVKQYNKILKKITDADKDLLSMYFEKVSKKDFDGSGILDKYKTAKKQDVYYCNVDLNEREKKKLTVIFKKAKYSKSTYSDEMKLLGIEETVSSYPNFKLKVCYLLTDFGLNVSIPNDSIKYNTDFPLCNITLLPYFGAEKCQDNSKGYLVIPDGSGAIIKFDKSLSNRYQIIKGTVYGDERTILEENYKNSGKQQYYLPVFGIVRNDESGLFSIIKSGDEMCDIVSYLAEGNCDYYSSCASFYYTHYEPYIKDSKVENKWSRQNIYLYSEKNTKSDFSIDFYTINNATYVDMANIYHKYLLSVGLKEKSNNTSQIHISTIGSALTDCSFLGFKYKGETAFTTYSQNIKIIESLADNKINNISLTLLGWQKYGLDCGVTTHLSYSNKLGGKSKFKKLSKYCKNKNIYLTPSVEFTFTKYDRVFDGFSKSSDATKSLDNKLSIYEISSVDLRKKEGFWISPKKSKKYIENFTEKYKNISNSIGVGNIGINLVSSFSKGNTLLRSESLKTVKAGLQNIKNSELTFSGSNAYILPYADTLNYIPACENSGYVGETYAIPFLQLSLGESVVCNSNPINLCDDITKELLNCLQSSTIPTFVVSYQNTEQIKSTNHTDYYAVDYKIIKPIIIDSFEFLREAYSAIGGSYIVSHKIIDNNITLVKFSNGKSILINLSDDLYYYNDSVIKANSYKICV